jgi:prepilin-type N-terminal cleavage/methylation domain-containing protein
MTYLDTPNSQKTYGHAIKRHQAGFTLLELVLVLFLMSMLASATLFLTENVEQQAMYDETKHRLNVMRQAIIGDSTRRLNGVTEVGGFVADMKRLPGCVSELLEPYNCGGTDITLWSQDTSTGVYAGWRGPYIQVIPESGNQLRFRDGFNSKHDNDASDALNSGWDWTLWNDTSAASVTDIADTTGIKLKSNGGGTEYEVAEIELVQQADWSIDNLLINLVNSSSVAQPSVDSHLILRVYLNDTSVADGGNTSSTTPHVLSAGSLPAYSSHTFLFSFDAPTLPIGTHGYALVCGNHADQIFTSDCSSSASPSASEIKIITALPRRTTTLDWTLQ